MASTRLSWTLLCLLSPLVFCPDASAEDDKARYAALERERFYFLDDGSRGTLMCQVKADVLDEAIAVIQDYRRSGRLLATMKETTSNFSLNYTRDGGDLSFTRPTLSLSTPDGMVLDDSTRQRLSLGQAQLQTSFRRQVEGVVSTLRGVFDELSRSRLDKISQVRVITTLKGYEASFRTQFGTFNVTVDGSEKRMKMVGLRGGGMTGTSRYTPLGDQGLALTSMRSQSTGDAAQGYTLKVTYQRLERLWTPSTITVTPISTPPKGQGFPGMNISLSGCQLTGTP